MYTLTYNECDSLTSKYKITLDGLKSFNKSIKLPRFQHDGFDNQCEKSMNLFSTGEKKTLLYSFLLLLLLNTKEVLKN